MFSYDDDYEEALRYFVQAYQDFQGEVIVRPHPKTDGALEKRLTEGTSIQVGEMLSTAESLGRAECIVIHRSSLGIKASLSGKKVVSIESDGSVREVIHEVAASLPTREGHISKYDSEYVRGGVSNMFMFFEPLGGRRHVEVTDRRQRWTLQKG